MCLIFSMYLIQSLFLKLLEKIKEYVSKKLYLPNLCPISLGKSEKIEPTSRSQMDILRCQPSVSNNIQNGISLRRHRGKRSCCCSQCAVSSWLQTKGKLVQALCVRLLLLFLSDWHWSQCHFQVVLRFWLRKLFRQKVWKMTIDIWSLLVDDNVNIGF